MFFRIFIEQRAKQIKQFFIQLNIIKLKTREFNCIVCAKNIKIFSIILRKIDVFLNLIEILSRFKLDFV